jgi:hypothetical protein
MRKADAKHGGGPKLEIEPQPCARCGKGRSLLDLCDACRAEIGRCPECGRGLGYWRTLDKVSCAICGYSRRVAPVVHLGVNEAGEVEGCDGHDPAELPAEPRRMIRLRPGSATERAHGIRREPEQGELFALFEVKP